MRYLIALIFLCATAANAQEGDVVSDQLFSFEAGIVCAPETIGTSPATNTVAGVTNAIEEDPPFVSLTRRVPAVLGFGFGIKAMAMDANGIAPVTMTITHPAMTQTKTTQQSFDTLISGIDPSLTFYQFDFAYELLPGRWVMEATQGDTVLYRAAFQVVAPNKVPELASVCGFAELLS